MGHRILILMFLFFFGLAYSQKSPHGKLKYQCSVCHTSESWKFDPKRASFNHEDTGFKLEGQHMLVRCEGCHKKLVFSGATQNCVSCHLDLHRGTLGSNCRRCHDSNTWKIADFREKHTATRFVLTGAHREIPCGSCHKSMSEFSAISLECIGCHKKDYDEVQMPNHILANFPFDCLNCHKQNAFSWKDVNFVHPDKPLKLDGKHAQAQCYMCHRGVFVGTPSDCFSCHQQNYFNASNPNHQQAGFSHSCLDCHTTDGWRPSTFDHSGTGFPLTGRHVQVQCSSCHRGVFAGTPSDCFSCHQSAYTGALTPVHTVGYPTACEMCHTTSGWRPSSFSHDVQYFRIYSGKHAYSRGRWRLCADCHPSAPNLFNTFTCTTACHPQDKMNKEHRNVAGYIYNSQNCYSCHKGV